MNGAFGSIPFVCTTLFVMPEALAASNRNQTRPPGGLAAGNSAVRAISVSPVKVPTLIVFAPEVSVLSGP